METRRTHDEFYLQEERKDDPKEYFKFILRRFSKLERPESCVKILDVGCATGDFLYYLAQNFPKAELYGMDRLPILLEKAKRINPRAKFFQGDIFSGEIFAEKGENIWTDFGGGFDYIFMLGVHSIFDEIKKVIENLRYLMRAEGKIYIFGIFNPYEIDVIIRSRSSHSDGEWESGWNLFSLATAVRVTDELDLYCNVEPFRINIDIPENLSDPLRSYTFLRMDGEREVVNGLQLLHKFYLLEIGYKEKGKKL